MDIEVKNVVIPILKGEKGDPGINGRDGQNGANGVNGQDGANGQDGKSAYEIWLDLGNIGTEQDFINSLKGADGADGQDGQDGADGQNGQDGQDGADGQDGYTPVKGTDYFTQTEINQFTTTITNNVNANIGLAVDSINGEVV